jgi:hypothetical protein
MTEMQRWALDYDVMIQEEEGQWVKASDAETAISAAFRSGMEQMIGGIEQVSYDKGQQDMLAKCIVTVEALPTSWLGPSPIAALRALEEQP